MAEPTRVLILGGTAEAAALARALAEDARVAATTSLAGRTRAPAELPGAVRRGGFGGTRALADYLEARAVDLLVDATHPFAARISRNAAQACAAAGVPRLVLTRAPWTVRDGDRWIPVPDTEAAATALPGLGTRVFLTIGRQELAAFAGLDAVWFLVRLVEPPEGPIPLDEYHLVLGRGPFSLEREAALLREHGIEVVASKNSGGAGTYAKIEAARALGLPVVMVERPALPEGETVESVAAALAWIEPRLA
jgi:precorrin-6A/cobalt-precorrin-6A reductase